MISTRIATAEWANPSLVAEKHRFESGKFWLGRAAEDDTISIGYSDDRHICLVSGNRGGKGTTTIINNLCLYPGSVVVVDPKGENATVTAARRGGGSKHCKGMGQAVYVLDPFKTAQIAENYRSCFNPLDALDPQNEESIDEASRIADALVVINSDSKDPFWDESGRSMIKGLILHVLTAEEFEGRRNLVTIRDLITRGDWKAVEILREMGEENIASGQALLWEGVRNNMAFNGIIAGIGETFVSMATNSPKQFESVIQVANRNTEFIDSPGMRKCLSSSDFELSDLKTNSKGVSLYLSLPQRYMNTHYRWLRMMIALTITEMEKVREKPATGHRILMCLDEFAGLKRMEIIESAVAQIAGFGVTLFFVLQSLEQLKATYKDNWETFLANSGLKIFFSLEDHFSREYISKFIGDTELIREVRSSSRSESESESTSHTESRSTSKSRSSSRSDNFSRNRSNSGGKNRSTSRSEGSSDGMSWKRRWALLTFRKDKQYNEGRNRSQGSSDGTNQGWSAGTSSGASRTYGTSTSETYGTSDSTTSGTSRSSTEGMSETVHRRALITPDEIGKYFGRITDRFHPVYPGLGLVLISGENPFAVSRVNYYQDAFFYKLFDPHPDFGEIAYEVIISPPDMELLEYGNIDLRLNADLESHITKGEVIYYRTSPDKKMKDVASNPIFEGDLPKPIMGLLEPYLLSVTFPENVILNAPISGKVKQIEDNMLVVSTDNPNIDYSVEEENREKIFQYWNEYHETYRSLSTFYLVMCGLTALFAAFWGIQIITFFLGASSILFLPFELVNYLHQVIITEMSKKGSITADAQNNLNWGVFIAKIIVFLILASLSWQIFKLPSKLFSEARENAEKLLGSSFEKESDNLLRQLFSK